MRPKLPPERLAKGWIETLDGRTGIKQDMQARFAEICSDLGGEGTLSYMQRSLIERALWLEYWLGQQERDLAQGKEFDVGKWVQAANSLQGVYSRLGIERRTKDVTSLADYINAKAAP